MAEEKKNKEEEEKYELIKKYLLEKKGLEEISNLVELLKQSGKTDVLGRMLEFYGMRQILEKLTSDKGVGLEEVLKYAILRDLLRPQMDLTQLIALMKASENKGGSDDILKLLLTLQQQQMQQNQQLLITLFGNRIQELQSTMQNQQQDLLTRLQDLENKISGSPTLEQELERYIKFRETMLKFAEEEGLTKEQVTTPEGKINWAKLLDKIIKVVEKGFEKMSEKPPAFSPPPQIPLTQVTEIPKETSIPKGFSLPKTEISYGTTTQSISEQKISEEIHSAGTEESKTQ